MHRAITGRLVIATHNKGKLAEMRELLGAAWRRGGVGERAEPARAGRDRHDLRGECAHQGRSRRAGVRPAGLRRRFQAWRSMRSTARPASIRRAGPARRRISATRWRRSRPACASATPSRRRSARRISSRCCASPGRTAMSRNSRARSTARWSGRRAARKASATIRCSCPTGFDLTFGEMTSDQKHGLPPKGQGLSHRARAFLKLAEACLERNNTSPLAGEVGEREPGGGAFGVYVHWPFCLSKCPYCDFNSHVRHTGIDEERYVRAFAAEIATTARTHRRAHGVEHLHGRRHAVADEARDGRRDPRHHRQALVGRARRRGDARSQSDQRRGDALSRLSRGRASTACRSACRRSTMRR